ncbi:hypothetical protein [Actinopolymorpha pittospori]
MHCDPDQLIAALVRATADQGGTLSLARKCTYTLTANEDGNGLPLITQRVAIEGNGATIVRAANAEDFRIFEVGFGGDMKLHDLTIKGGVGTEVTAGGSGVGGGGLLVQEGGRATITQSTFTLNRSITVGGAVANYGVTDITGGDARKSDSSSKGESSWTHITKNTAVMTFAQGAGGGLFNAGSLTAEHTRIDHNDAVDQPNPVEGTAGGGLQNTGGTVGLNDVRIDHNHAAGAGGGVALSAGENAEFGTITLKNSSVTDNSSESTGGGINNLQGNLYLKHTAVRHNSATSDGGGILNAVGQVVADASRIDENTSSGFGGGVTNTDFGTVVLRRTDVNENRAIGSTSSGGGINNIEGQTTLTDSDVIGNFSVNAPGGVESNVGMVDVDDESTIIRNRPTNCEGATTPIPNCFG